MPDDRVAQLLAEIRDAQREQLALTREALAHTAAQARLAQEAAERSIRNQEQSMAVQARAVEVQRNTARLYRIVVALVGHGDLGAAALAQLGGSLVESAAGHGDPVMGRAAGGEQGERPDRGASPEDRHLS